MTSRAGILSWFVSPPPAVGLEIAAGRVTAVAIGSHAGKSVVSAHATERLPDGAVLPSLNATNIVDRAVVTAAVGRVLEAVGGRAARIALVVPDGATKVSLVKFDKLPAKAQDLDRMVRWQVKKTVPFAIDQAQVSWTRGATDAAGATDMVVALARRDIIEEYESVAVAVGARPGLVDCATFNLIDLAMVADPSLCAPVQTAEGTTTAMDWLLVHVCADSSTIAIVRGDQLMFFRNRPADAKGRLSDLVHQTAMYYEDRLGGRGFSRVLVTARDVPDAASAEVDELYRSLTERSGDRVDVLDLRGAAGLADRIQPGPELLSALAAPVGAVLREVAA
jgi:Tfp pilus assembly PilM family ATPase